MSESNHYRIQVYDTFPEGFCAQVEVSAIYVVIENHVLFLQRGKCRVENGKWGVPAGKLEKNESPLDAAIRELFEETGIEVDRAALINLGTLYMRKPDLDYAYHSFELKLNQFPLVVLSDEHHAHRWVGKNEVEHLELMDGAKEAFELFHPSQ